MMPDVAGTKKIFALLGGREIYRKLRKEYSNKFNKQFPSFDYLNFHKPEQYIKELKECLETGVPLSREMKIITWEDIEAIDTDD